MLAVTQERQEPHSFDIQTLQTKKIIVYFLGIPFVILFSNLLIEAIYPSSLR